MSYAAEIRETGLDIRRRLGLWKPFEPVKWRSPAAPPTAEELERRKAKAAALARLKAKRLAVIERIERRMGRYGEAARLVRPGAAILAETAHKHGFTVKQMKAHRRHKTLVKARAEAMWRMFQETSLSLPQIGAVCGGFDHSSVIHSIRRHAAEREGRVYRKGCPHKSQVA